MSPGTLIHVGEQKSEKTAVHLIEYSQNTIREIVIQSMEQCLESNSSQQVTWIEVYGLHDISVIEELGKIFEIHPLVLEDILNANQRPKFEEYENQNFVILKNLKYKEEFKSIESEQISIVTGHNYVIAFHETKNDLFEPVHQRLMNSKLRIRKRGADYLAYALMDTIVDHYFIVLEMLGEQLEEMKSKIMEQMDQKDLKSIFELKKCFTAARKAIWPLKDIVSKILDEEYPLVSEPTLLYFRDLRDHIHQIIDSLDSYRESATNVIDTYLSVMSMKMNEVMKVLTIAATIFMPLTFIVGIYGMNFKYMPELDWRWGYFVVLGLMSALIFIMVIYFKRKKWF